MKDLKERLLKVDSDPMGCGLSNNSHRNPDGLAAVEAITHLEAEIAALNGRLVETQIRAHKWMEAHDKLQAGKPYEFPKPADLPDALAEITALREGLRDIARLARPQSYAAERARALLDQPK